MNGINKKKLGVYAGVGILTLSIGYYGLFANTEKNNSIDNISNINTAQQKTVEDKKTSVTQDIQITDNTVNQAKDPVNNKTDNSVIEKTNETLQPVKPVETKRESNSSETNKIQQPKPTAVDGLKILKSEVTETAKFYPYQAGSTYMEVIAVKATDGSIRTALNTCQVCFDSGRGYYKQSGDFLICQNCRNRFHIDQVELVKGGCNPVPVLGQDKKDLGDSILISKDFLESQKEYFAKWKR